MGLGDMEEYEAAEAYPASFTITDLIVYLALEDEIWEARYTAFLERSRRSM